MSQDPDQIRSEIEETRERMAERADALGYKADVPGRAKEFVADKKDAVRDKKDAVVSKVKGATPDTESMKEGAQKAGGMAKENPLGLAIGAAAAGFITGLVVPSTRVEDERLGEVATQLKEQVRETGQEAFERGKHVAQEAVQSATETARESAGREGQELTDSLRQRTHETTSG